MNTKIKLLSLLLALVMLFASCGPVIEQPTEAKTEITTETSEVTTEKQTETPTEEPSEETTEKVPEETLEPVPENEQIEYSRAKNARQKSELIAMYTLTEEDYENAIALLNTFLDAGLNSPDYEEVDAKYYEFEDAFYHIQTQNSIASIIYYCNMKDETAQANDSFATEKLLALRDEYIAACKELYLNSPHKDELFADWTEKDIQDMLGYDPETSRLMERNEEIKKEAANLSDAEWYDKIPELYIEFVQNNNKIAQLAGYDNYYDYATVEVYDRDYTREDLEIFKTNFLAYVYPNENTIYLNYKDKVNTLNQSQIDSINAFLSGAFDTLGKGKNYVVKYVNSVPGNHGESMRHMFENRNFIIATNPNAHQSAFQTYLPEFETPFCLFGASNDSMTVVHEMGHYYAALTNNDLTSLDLMETHSQANEYLFLNFVEKEMDPTLFDVFMGFNMYVNYANFITCLIVDEFEYRIYTMDSLEGFTSADFDAIIAEICEMYGGYPRVSGSYVDVKEYWRQIVLEAPVYYISYAVSLTEALNIYALADESIIEAHRVYSYIVEEAIPEDKFIITLQKAGLTSPFDEETMIKIAEVMIK